MMKLLVGDNYAYYEIREEIGACPSSQEVPMVPLVKQLHIPQANHDLDHFSPNFYMQYIEGIHYSNMRLHSIIIIMGCQCNYLGKKLIFNNAKHAIY
jgi:hypothetical protein